MRRGTKDGVPVPVLRWHSEKQRDDGANRPSQRVRQPVLGKDRQGHRCDATTFAHMPAMPNGRVVSARVGANPRAAHHTIGTPVLSEELGERGKERSIGLWLLSAATRKVLEKPATAGQSRPESCQKAPAQALRRV